MTCVNSDNPSTDQTPDEGWATYTDNRLITKEVAKASKKATAYQAGYWTGVLCCRADPHVRALRVYYNEQTKKPHHRLFSYDEIIATAALMSIGIPKRVAAAMAFYELAIAVPCGCGFDADGREADRFKAIRVCLDDGSLWDVAIENNFKSSRLEFVGDFAVWFEADGKRSDPDHAPFPSRSLDVIGMVQVEDIPKSSVH